MLECDEVIFGVLPYARDVYKGVLGRVLHHRRRNEASNAQDHADLERSLTHYLYERRAETWTVIEGQTVRIPRRLVPYHTCRDVAEGDGDPDK